MMTMLLMMIITMPRSVVADGEDDDELSGTLIDTVFAVLFSAGTVSCPDVYAVVCLFVPLLVGSPSSQVSQHLGLKGSRSGRGGFLETERVHHLVQAENNRR